MEPRLRKGYIVNVSPSRTPRTGDDVFVKLAAKSGNAPKFRIMELVSLDRKTARFVQLNPKKTLTLQRKDVVVLHRVIGAWQISPEERMRAYGLPVKVNTAPPADLLGAVRAEKARRQAGRKAA